MSVRSGAEKMKSAAFASTTVRPGITLPEAAMPGAGTYSPDFSAISSTGMGNLLSKTGRDHKFVSDQLDGMGNDANTGPLVGPGSYSPEVGTIARENERMGHSLSASVVSEFHRKLEDLW